MTKEKKMPRYLDPKSDIVFKKIFGNHPDLLKSFLNALLPLPEDSIIESLEYLSSENVPEIPALKSTIVDVRCTDQQGRHFIVEMQIEWVPAFMQRVLFNTSSVYVKQIQRGERYSTLCPVYGLALLAHNFRENDPNWIHHYKMTHNSGKHSLDDMHLVFVELPKFKPSTIADRRLTILWLRFMSEVDEKTDIIDPELLTVPEIKEAATLAHISAFSRAELNAYDAYWDVVSTNATIMEGKFIMGEAKGHAKGHAEGLAKGLAEGHAEGMLEERKTIAKKLLSTGMDIDLIMQITQLPADQIKVL